MDVQRSGNFLMEPKGSGKEIMRGIIGKEKVGNRETDRQGRKRGVLCGVCASVLFICIILGGCTRREQLVLETGSNTGAAQGTTADGQTQNIAAQGSSEQAPQGTAADGQTQNTAGQQAAQDQNAAGQQAQPPQEQNVAGQQGQNASGQQPQNIAGQQAQPQTPQDGTAAQDQGSIWVHICGAVKCPDVYELPTGSRVYEAVKLAGGFTEEADESYVNQAQPLSDGVKIVIPTREQTRSLAAGEGDGGIGIVGATGLQADDGNPGSATGTDSGEASGASADGRVNINTATETQLCGIAGIGATRAAAIVAYRQEHGSFARIEDIMNVSGIKEGTYAKIRDSITVN